MDTQNTPPPKSKIDLLKDELEALRESNRTREKEKRRLIQRAQARESTAKRKEEAHALCCLAGALLKYRRHIADEVLAELAGDPNAPNGHADAILKILEASYEKRNQKHNR